MAVLLFSGRAAAVVANENKSTIGGVLLNHPTQRKLGSTRHVVRLVQNPGYTGIPEIIIIYYKIQGLIHQVMLIDIFCVAR